MATTSAAARPRYSENMHFLTDRAMREVIIGLAVESAAEAGPDVRPKEGEEIRKLLTIALDELEQSMSQRRFRAIRARGAQALNERDQFIRDTTAATPLAPLKA